ncbi:hypothetical protein [Streptomyces sp. TRM64462]|uniref:hypothetical protein n=1 Tax=Streptomyces sp. TRM64462 TaxID=2741726 RepID=UPI001585F4CD|nr:hypothetical protein [Streptomyces sp. TRM64462]
MTLRNHKIALALMSALTGVALFATGCSQSSDSPGPSESTSGSGGSDGSGPDTAAFDKAQALRTCLRDKGMDVPDLQPGENPYSTMLAPPQGTDPAKWTQALEDCGSGAGGSGGGGDAGGQQALDQQVKIAECLRGKGFDMPDPKAGPDGSRNAWQVPQGADPDKFLTALNECAA